MDDFKRQSCKEVGVKGMKCKCCRPTDGKKKLRKRCRSRLKEKTKMEVKEQKLSSSTLD